MTDHGQIRPVDPGQALLELYNVALPEVYGYVLRRCSSQAVAEDVTAEAFLAAVDAVRLGRVAMPTIAWLIGIARHKLVDHWRRVEREERGLWLIHTAAETDDPGEPWRVAMDEYRAIAVLQALGPHHRAALNLRYLDGLAVPAVAEHLGRTVHATEALLMRAKAAFRVAYTRSEHG